MIALPSIIMNLCFAIEQEGEVRAGIEPAYRSFADSRLTTWLPYQCEFPMIKSQFLNGFLQTPAWTLPRRMTGTWLPYHNRDSRYHEHINYSRIKLPRGSFISDFLFLISQFLNSLISHFLTNVHRQAPPPY